MSESELSAYEVSKWLNQNKDKIAIILPTVFFDKVLELNSCICAVKEGALICNVSEVE